MADILIRGIEMPKKKPICVVIDAAGQARQYDLLNDCYYDTDLYEVIELPEHGDLVEADYLKTIAYARGKEYSCVAFVDPVDITIAPVIVPSNKETKNAN